MSASGSGMGNVGFHRRQLGDIELVALHDGVLSRDWPPGFVRNVDDATAQAAFAQAGMPPDRLTITFSPLLVKAGERLVLIDTGFGTGGPPGTGRTVENLHAAGLGPEQVTDVIISHFHGDHIMGLPAFTGAKLHLPKPELAFWLEPSNRDKLPEMARQQFDAAQQMIGPLAGAANTFDWGDEILPGLRAVDAKGHTPGMTAIAIGSGAAQALFVADITNNPLVFARHPGWQAMFDMDPEQSIRTRERLLREAAADRRLLFFFHAPFPGFGYVVQSGDGFEYLPALWQ